MRDRRRRTSRRRGSGSTATLLLVALLAGPVGAAGTPSAASAEVPRPEVVAPRELPQDPVQDLYVVAGALAEESTAQCRAGDHVVNGGWETPPGAGGRGEHAVYANAPALDARGWEAAAADGVVRAYAVCVALLEGHLYVVERHNVLNSTSPRCDDEESEQCDALVYSEPADAACRDGDRLVGGGWTTGRSRHATLDASYPMAGDRASQPSPATTWRVESTLGAARAVCAPRGTLFADVQTVSTDEPHLLGERYARSAFCPAGTALIGGGWRGRHQLMLGSHPRSPNGWVSGQAAGGSEQRQLTGVTTALCATLGAAFTSSGMSQTAHVPEGGGLAVARCPEGHRVWGGGVALDPHPTELDQGQWSSAPGVDGASWTMLARHTGSAHATCLRPARSTATTLEVETAPAYEGEPVTLAARTVAPSGSPSGSVVFLSGPTVLGRSTLGVDGEARLRVDTLTAGAHSLTAHYEGAATFDRSASGATPLQVRPPRAETELALTASSDPAPRGEPVTLRAAVTTTTATTPTGHVLFRVAGVDVGTAPLGPDGVARLTHTFVDRDVHVLQAVYGGDDAHRRSTGFLSLQVATLLTVDDVVVEEAEAAPVTGQLHLRLSEPLAEEVAVRVSADPAAAELFPGGTAPQWDVVLRPGEVTAAVPLTVAAQLRHGDRAFRLAVARRSGDVHVVRDTARGTVRVTHPTCTVSDLRGTGRLRGTDGPDVLCGLDGDDEVQGFGGSDVLLGGDGDDDLLAGPGDDRVVGGRGDDRLVAGAGTDALLAHDGVGGNDRLVGHRSTTCTADPEDHRSGC